MTKKRLEGKVAFISGGGSGIGAATAVRFADEGATVVICGRRKEPLDEVVAQISRAGGKAEAVPADVGDERAEAQQHDGHEQRQDGHGAALVARERSNGRHGADHANHRRETQPRRRQLPPPSPPPPPPEPLPKLSVVSIPSGGMDLPAL